MSVADTGDTGQIVLLSGGNRPINVPAGANYIHVYEATGLFVLKLFRKGTLIESHVVSAQVTLNRRDYDRMVVKDISEANNTIRVFYGPGDYVPPGATDINVGNTVDVNILSGNVTVNNAQPNDIIPLPDVSVGAAPTIIAAADSASLEVLLMIPSGQDFGIRLGDNTTTSSQGFLLEPGVPAVVNLANHDLYGVRESGATGNVTITVSKLNRS